MSYEIFQHTNLGSKSAILYLQAQNRMGALDTLHPNGWGIPELIQYANARVKKAGKRGIGEARAAINTIRAILKAQEEASK